MEYEYRQDERLAGERLVLKNGGSSAHVLRADELNDSDRRRKEAESGTSDSQYVEMFCERYRDRGIAGRVYADALLQEKKEALGRAAAPGAYVMKEKLVGKEQLNVYKSGVSNGRRYMTVEDFNRYYHDQRGYKFPQYREVTDKEREAAVIAATSVREMRPEQPKKAVWLTDTDKVPAFVRKFARTRVGIFLNEWAGKTFPRETEMRTDTHRRVRPVPAGAVAALVTIVVSMSMVISSTVLVSRSTREVSQLKDSLSEMREVRDELSDRLDLKNDMLDIQDKAVNELGMVPEKYVDGKYLTDRKEDELEVFDEDAEKDKWGLSALLSAFGFGKD